MEIITIAKVIKGYRLSKSRSNTMCFADDDALLIAENEDFLQRLVSEFRSACKLFNIKLPTKKAVQNYDDWGGACTVIDN